MKIKVLSRAALTLLGCIVLFLVTTIFARQLSAPQSNDETTARLVCDMVERYHISNSEIDDKISKKLLNRYLKQLDPMKLYLMQSDIDALKRYEYDLDDLIEAGNVDFAYSTYRLYLKRQQTQMAAAEELIDSEHDFTIEEEMIYDADELKWAKTEAELRERLRKRIKYEILSLKLDDTPLDEARERIHRRYHTIAKETLQTSNFEKLEMYLSALTHCFDPHSSYMSPQTLEDFRISMELSLEGIGAALKSDDGFTIVAKIVPGGAADKDKRLKVGDKIVGVAQDDNEIVDIVEMKLSRVVRYIRGEKGTKVRLEVKTADAEKTQIYELIRQKIELKSSAVKGEIIDTTGRIDGSRSRVGIVNIPSFYRDFRGAQRGDVNFKSTVRDVRNVLADFRDAGSVDLVIVDLRGNGGGALSEAIEVSGLFIDHGPIVQVKQQDGKVKYHNDEEDEADELAYSGPLVVICNRLSASASEIFAGVIKDYERGIIIGDTTTHGKGTVQNVMPVSRQFFQLLNPQDRGALKLTINQFYRVNGDSTQNRGVRSDVVLPSLLDEMEFGEEYLDNALEFDRIAPADYSVLHLVNKEMISVLQKSSGRRIAESKKFKEVNEDIAKYLKRKNRKVISLNEETLRKEREDSKREDEAEKTAEEELDTDGPIFPKGHYNDELLQIGLDYVSLLKGPRTAKN